MAPTPELLDASAPPERRGIARDAVRMLVTQRTARTHTHARFFELPSFLRSGDLVVVNDSATLPAALAATRVNGESLALHVATKIDSRVWLAEPRAPVLLGEELRLRNGGSAVMIAPVEPEHARLWYVWFHLPLPMYAYLAEAGEPIHYRHVLGRFPLGDFETMFAREPGSSEMPSAARPFTPRVVAALRRHGIELAKVTLHCGVSSFEVPERPAMERFSVSHETAERVNEAKREGRRVIAIGTTALRALESAVPGGKVVAASGWTDLVIDEHHRLMVADGLLTGFHDAAATHPWVLRAFLDRELLDSAYQAAAQEAYYRHEFGDVHLIV
jgi:S-adenosylmethionine:tRNA ribosyltransferase-isomerase